MKRLFAIFLIFALAFTYNYFAPSWKIDKTSAQYAYKNTRLLKAYQFKQKQIRKTQQKYDKPDQAMQYEVALRSELDKPYSWPDNWRVQALKQARQSLALNKTAGALTWQEKGPGNVGGRSRTIVVHPQNNEIWWIGAVGGGIWKTTDAGQSWTCQSDSLPVLSVTTIANCQQQPDVLYAGTGEGFYNSDAIVGDGIFKTSDGGSHWQQLASTVGNYDFRFVNRLVVHPQNPDTLLAATNSGVFRSDDGGQTWQTVFQNGNRVQQIIANPTNFHTLFIAVEGNGIYKSVDMGQNWGTKVSEEITNHYRIEMAIAAADTSILYASAVNSSSGLEGFYISRDGGNGWKKLTSSPNWLGGQGWYDNTLVVDPFNPEIVFVGGIDLYRVNADSTNFKVDVISNWYGGNGLPYVHADQHFLVTLPGEDGNYALLAANDGGIFYSTDKGLNWTSKNNNYNVTQFYDADKNPVYRQYIAGAQDNGTNMSLKDPGYDSKWQEVVGGDGFDCAWSKDEPNVLYATLYNSRIYKSIDGGNYFTSVANGLPESSIFHTPLAMDPHNSSILFTASLTDKIYRTTDGAANWQEFNCDLGSIPRIKISVSENSGDVVWAASSSSYINVSTDGGQTYNIVNKPEGAPNALLTGLGTFPQDSAGAIVTFGVYGYSKVFKTHDFGQNWQDITSNLPEVPVHCALVMPYDSSEIWLGTDVGLFITNNAGESWQFSDQNLPAVSIRRLKIVGQEIVAATHGRGVWTVLNDRLPQSELPLNTPMLYTLNYPNPANGMLKVEFAPRGAYDSLQVKVNGLAVETLYQFTAYEDTFITTQASDPNYYEIAVAGYKDGTVYDSQTEALWVYEQIDSLKENFNSGFSSFDGDFIISQDAGFPDNTLHTVHPYNDAQEQLAVLAAPVRITEGLRLRYKDVAIVEPGEPNTAYPDPQMWDYVAVEYSTDGENWTFLSRPYDSRFNSDWQFYFESSLAADQYLFQTQEIILSDSIEIGKSAYIRFRLFADEYSNGWGWALDDIYIGKQDLTDISQSSQPLHRYQLFNNYPNPFNPQTTIRYELARRGNVDITIFNALGQQIFSKHLSKQDAGVHSFIFDGSPFASGVYFYKLETETFSKTKKMMLLK